MRPRPDARGLAGVLARGEATAEEVVAAHLDRIAERNPAVNAVVGLRDRDAVLAASAQVFPFPVVAGGDRGPADGQLPALGGDGRAYEDATAWVTEHPPLITGTGT